MSLNARSGQLLSLAVLSRNPLWVAGFRHSPKPRPARPQLPRGARAGARPGGKPPAQPQRHPANPASISSNATAPGRAGAAQPRRAGWVTNDVVAPLLSS